MTEPRDVDGPRNEPIAIVGMSCRFAPDLLSPAELWDFLMARGHHTSEMPERRWRGYAQSSPEATTRLRATTLTGTYLSDIEGFDAEFFGISPKEAAYLDPQQRFMLELTWEALVSAGIPPSSLAGTDTGVYAAANSTDYGRRLLEDMRSTGAYAVNGTTDYGIANRVSYHLDTHGPSLAVNTACAASLTALDLACAHLRSGEVPLAVVGGMNLVSTPALNVALENAGALAQDGRSKAFDLGANGYGRGEGAGVLVLKRLGDAERDGDPVLAVVRASGVFQDGRSDGMMAPRSQAQAHMLRSVYERAGIEPGTVSYVEAHGTGTPAGDGAELRALREVVGQGRDQADPCLIGSVKPNIGHVEGGSGIAGVIKVVLALLHETLPPSLHEQPTDLIDWDEARLRLVADATPWPVGPEGATPRRAGVSNYGVGGTIAHLVLEEAPRATAAGSAGSAGSAAPSGVRHVVPLSGASESAVRELAGRAATWLRESDPALEDVAHTAVARRTHLRHRLAVVAETTEVLADALDRAALGATHPALVTGSVVTGAGPVVWVYSGHGAQWEGMGQGLLDTDEAFTRVVDELAEVYGEELGWTPREAITQGGPWSASAVQALTFAVQAALTASWRARGLEPDAIVGHSVGEIAANVAAGTLDLAAAARFACRRAAALQRLAGRGAMMMVSLGFDDVAREVALVDGVEAGICAGPASTVVTGDASAVAALAADWDRRGVAWRAVATDIAFHSAHVDEIVAEVGAAAADLVGRPAAVPIYSTALADPRSGAARDRAYWVANLREPVRFAQAIEAAVADGHHAFLEVSSHPVVLHSVHEVAESLGVEVVATPTLRRGQDDPAVLDRQAAALYCAGIDGALAHPAGRLAPLPGVVWQHRDYWIFDDARQGVGAGHDPVRHTLLGGRLAVAGAPARQVWQTRLDLGSRPYPLNHELEGVEVVPAAAILNSFLEAVPDGSGATCLTDVVLRTPLAVEPPRVVQVVREGRMLSLATRIADEPGGPDGEAVDADDAWLTHTTAVHHETSGPGAAGIDTARLRAELPAYPARELHDMFARMGVGGYAFPWDLDELRRGPEDQLAVMVLPDLPGTPTTWAHVVDAALTISAALVTPADATSLWMSRHVASVTVDGVPPSTIVVHSRRTTGTDRGSVDVTVTDLEGRPALVVEALRFSPVENLERSSRPRDLVHDLSWVEVDLAEGADGAAAPGSALVVGDGARADAVAAAMARLGGPVARLDLGALAARELPAAGGPDEVVVLVLPDDEVAPAGGGVPAAALDTTEAVVAATQAVLGSVLAPGARRHLWVVTTGVRAAVSPTSVAHAAAWGAGRIVAGEHPEMWGGTIDLSPGLDPASVDWPHLLAQAPGSHDVLAVSPDSVATARLAPVGVGTALAPLRCDPAGTVLVTGGLGPLGFETARWLAERGLRRVVLLGRTALPARDQWDRVVDPAVRARIDGVLALEAEGVGVQTAAVDVADPAALHAFLERHRAEQAPITGIVHAAGTTHDELVDTIDRSALAGVLAPKTTGAWNLHRAFPVGTLDFFLVFSSCGQLARLSGQVAYAAANSTLDAIAALRDAAGDRRAVSLAWTAWDGVGMSADLGTTMLEANTRGLGAVSVHEATQAWHLADRSAGAYKAVLRRLPVPPGMPVPPAFVGLAELSATEDDTDQALFVLAPGLSASDQVEAVVAEVSTQVAAELDLDPGTLDPRRPLVELGVDSVMAVALRVRVQRTFGLALPSTILWAKPTVHELSVHLHDLLLAAAEAEPAPQGPSVAEPVPVA